MGDRLVLRNHPLDHDLDRPRRLTPCLNSPPNDLIVHRALAPFLWSCPWWLGPPKASRPKDSSAFLKPRRTPQRGFFLLIHLPFPVGLGSRTFSSPVICLRNAWSCFLCCWG
jgi:hypothetical protein